MRGRLPWTASRGRLGDRGAAAKSYRAGGATDLRVHLGDDDKSKAVIKGRGRWWSDVAEIYQRTLLSAQLLGSVAMGAVGGVDMEAMCAGWSQPS